MYVIRDIFQAKPGKARALAAVFNKNNAYLLGEKVISRGIVMTDVVAKYWTVVSQVEVEDLHRYTDLTRGYTSSPEVAEIFRGYMDLIESGHREIFRIEPQEEADAAPAHANEKTAASSWR